MKKPAARLAEARSAAPARRRALAPFEGGDDALLAVSEKGLAKPAKQERSLRSLERLLGAAETVLARDGWDAFTMNAVAVEAGASVGGIYRRFPSKEHLLRAIKDNALSRADAKYKTLLDYKAASLDDAVAHYVKFRIEVLLSYAGLLRKILDAQGGDQLMQDRGRQSATMSLRVFRSMLAPFRSEFGHAKPDIAVDVAFFTLHAVVIRRVQELSHDTAFEHTDWPTLEAELTHMLVSYLRAKAR